VSPAGEDGPVPRDGGAPSPRGSALSIRGLRKSFAGVTVLHGVDLDVDRGEIHGLIGPNGSGKSTLVKVLAGFHRADGTPDIAVGGRTLPAGFGLADVRAAGVGFVHQDLGLVGESSAADNLAFSAAGFVRGRGGRIRWKQHRARARAAFARVGLEIDPSTPVDRLGPAQRTLLAIARALGEFDEEALLVLDEPTAALPQQEVDGLFAALRRLAAEGTAMIYISHRLPELMSLTDRITVLRDGRVAASLVTDRIEREDLVVQMHGDVAPLPPALRRSHAGDDAPLRLRIEGVTTAVLQPTDLSVRPGEVVVLTGAVGCGASDVGRAIYGLSPTLDGRWWIDEAPFDPHRGPRSAKRAGVAYLPADRPGESSMPRLSVTENIFASGFGSVTRGGRIRWARAAEQAEALIEDYDVRPRDRHRELGSLSGGNQQKALLAKWLRLGPRLLVADEPTQGIDVATRQDIYQRLRAAAAGGLAVLWITSDFEEAGTIGDRVCVFVGGRLETELVGADATPERIGRHSLLGGEAMQTTQTPAPERAR
jgi:ribose transport system ATP-binding protein